MVGVESTVERTGAVVDPGEATAVAVLAAGPGTGHAGPGHAAGHTHAEVTPATCPQGRLVSPQSTASLASASTRRSASTGGGEVPAIALCNAVAGIVKNGIALPQIPLRLDLMLHLQVAKAIALLTMQVQNKFPISFLLRTLQAHILLV